jgi:hypothetical protein
MYLFSKYELTAEGESTVNFNELKSVASSQSRLQFKEVVKLNLHFFAQLGSPLPLND